MVQLKTFMVAAAAVMMGVQCLDEASAEAIESQLVASEIIPSSSASADEVVHADDFLDDIGNFFKNPPPFSLPIPIPSFSFGLLPKISDTPDNTIHVSIPAAIAPSHSASVAPVAKGKRAVSVEAFEPSSVSAAAAAPSASASASASHAHPHSHHKASVKAVLRARGMRGAGFRAAQHKSKSAEWESASHSASASAAEPEPSHLVRRDDIPEESASPSLSAEPAEITPIDEIISEAAANLADLDKLGEAVLGRDAFLSLSRAFQKEISAHSSELAALSMAFEKIGSVRLPKPTAKPVAH